MADGTIAITPGSGETVDVTDISVSGSTVARQRVVIAGNADAAGLLELPDHDAADAGPPLKIGGKAQRDVPTAVAAADRVNAWFTREGQQGCVATIEAAALYSNDATNGGRVVPLSAFTTQTLNNAAGSQVAASGNASTRCYVIAVKAVAYAITGAGYLTLRDNTTDIFCMGYAAALGDAGQGFHVAPPGAYLCRTTANTVLNLYFSGNGSIKCAVTYYYAP